MPAVSTPFDNLSPIPFLHSLSVCWISSDALSASHTCDDPQTRTCSTCLKGKLPGSLQGSSFPSPLFCYGAISLPAYCAGIARSSILYVYLNPPFALTGLLSYRRCISGLIYQPFSSLTISVPIDYKHILTTFSYHCQAIYSPSSYLFDYPYVFVTSNLLSSCSCPSYAFSSYFSPKQASPFLNLPIIFCQFLSNSCFRLRSLYLPVNCSTVTCGSTFSSKWNCLFRQ